MVDNKQQWKGWLYLLPALILLGIFTFWPIINTVSMAFQNGYESLESAGGGVSYSFGIQNFIDVINYKNFQNCLWNTVILCVITVPVSTLLALLISVALNSIRVLNRFLQTVYFLPYVTNSIAIGMVFAMMFNVIGLQANNWDNAISVGIINNLIQAFGGTPINWINAGSSKVANMAVMVIYIVWNALPFKILILLGGLQSINKQYYDAAKIDGANANTILWRITVPLLSPMLAYVIITGFIGGFKEYTSIVGVFGENMGPAGNKDSLNTIVGFIYRQMASDKYGRASAAALILFAIIFAVTLVNLYVSKKRVHY
jgi:multiple sugar transport system permease protein